MEFANIYIILVYPFLQFWGHLSCPENNIEPFFSAFSLERRSVFTLQGAHNGNLKER